MAGPKPLDGVLVLDLTRYLPGPLAAQLLAGLGARVLKVEEPAMGDPVRLAPPFEGEVGTLGALLLAGVESLALDLKKPAALDVLRRLLRDADVLLETFRPGTLARLGLDPRELRRQHPRLVIASISGWGQDGPYAARAGHDLTYQALAGALATTGARPHQPVADVVGAWSAAASVLAALYAREKSGDGAWIDAALFDAAVHTNLIGWAAEGDGPKAVGEPLALTGALPCYDLYETADGHLLALATLEPHFWRRFCEAVERPDLLGDHLRRDEAAHQRLRDLVASRDRRGWEKLLAAHDLPAELVLSAAEARDHPQVTARSVLHRTPGGGSRLAFPARFDGQRPRAGSEVPGHGEHTAALLEEWQIDPASLPWLRRRSGVGRRFSWKRLLTRLVARRH